MEEDEDTLAEQQFQEDLLGREEYETRGANKIQYVLKEQRNVTLDFKQACRLWCKFSDEEYCAGWMSMESFNDLDEKIVYAYDTYKDKI